VWAGEITNDTLEPLRSRALAAAAEARRPHPRHPRAPRTGPAGSEGRWSLRASRGSEIAGDTDRRAALAHALLDRYGVVTREAAHAEGVPGGFAAVYDVLKALEDQGRVRRGYFVQGRGGAQFALPGADERLRSHRDAEACAAPLVLAASDPANAYGGLLDWPAGKTEARPQRAAGALVVLGDGELLGWLGRGEHPLLTFLPEEEPARTEAARALAAALAARVTSSGARALLVPSIDGAFAADSPLARFFLEAGFVPTARGLLRRASPAPRAKPAAAET
jgi:ATP-dependent Lhr-like helicase